MEHRKDFDPKREEEHREHGRSDRPGQRPFPGEKDRPEHEPTPGREMGESRREPGRREPQQAPPGREQTPRKFGERRDQPPSGKREQR